MHSVTFSLWGSFDLQSYIDMFVQHIHDRGSETSISQKIKDFINQTLIFDSIVDGTGVTEREGVVRGQLDN